MMRSRISEGTVQDWVGGVAGLRTSACSRNALNESERRSSPSRKRSINATISAVSGSPEAVLFAARGIPGFAPKVCVRATLYRNIESVNVGLLLRGRPAAVLPLPLWLPCDAAHESHKVQLVCIRCLGVTFTIGIWSLF